MINDRVRSKVWRSDHQLWRKISNNTTGMARILVYDKINRQLVNFNFICEEVSRRLITTEEEGE